MNPIESAWQATSLALDALAGVPEDDPRVQALLGELDRLEAEAARLHLAKPIAERTMRAPRHQGPFAG